MLHKKGAPTDHPQRLAAPQRRHQFGLRGAQPEQVPQPLDLIGRLRQDHLGIGVGDQPLRDPRLARSLRPGRAQV